MSTSPAATAAVYDSPLQAGDLQLRNRIVYAPCTRNRGHVPGPAQWEYYAQRAKGGLLIHEGTLPELMGYEFSNAPGIYEKEQIAGHKRLTDAVHAAGGLIVLQVMNIGRVANPLLQGGRMNYGPSAVRAEGTRGFRHFDAADPYPHVDYVQHTVVRSTEQRVPRALADPWEVVESFRQAFVNAKAAGYDGVEVHGANGYLVHQFLDSSANRRADEWGGSPERRCKFALEVVKAAIDVWGAGRVGIKLSPSGGFQDMGMSEAETLATFGHLLRELERLSIAYVHIQRWFHLFDPARRGTIFEVATFRSLYRGTLLVNGDYTPGEGAAALASGEADAVVFGRHFMANPDLVERILADHPLSPFDYATAYEPGDKGYLDYKRWEELTAAEQEETRLQWAKAVQQHDRDRAEVPDLIRQQRDKEANDKQNGSQA